MTMPTYIFNTVYFTRLIVKEKSGVYLVAAGAVY